MAPVEIAGSFRARTVGLLGRRTIEGALWLPGVRSVHTLGMSFAIDVAFVDSDDAVLDVVTMPTGRICRPRRRAVGVLEAAAGRFADWGVVPGAELTIEAR